MVEKRLPSRFSFILHADIAGSTELVRQDESLAHQRIQKTFQDLGSIVEQYHGHVVELRGDALLAEFELASDAVSAAIAFQHRQQHYISQIDDDIQPLVRVGIASGEVIAADNTVTGSGVVIAQRIEQLTEPGDVCVTGAVHDALPERMHFDQDYLGKREVKGFDEKIQIYRVSLLAGQAIPLPQSAGRVAPSRKNLSISVVLVVLVVSVLAAGLYWFSSHSPTTDRASPDRMAFPLPDRPSIAVLPFDNLSGNTDQDYLADGLTEEIITTLSKSPNLFVIARNSIFTYKDTAVEVTQVAEEQGVRYVLEGSIQRSSDRIRVNIQLIDVLGGLHVWTEIYDRQFEDIFALQDDITQNIMIALEVELTQGEEVRLMHSRAPKLEAFLYLQKSRVHYYRFNREDNAIARELAMKAVEISPDYPDAWEWIGWYNFNDYRFAWSTEPNRSFKLAEEAANRAFDLDATVAGVNGLLGALSLMRGEYEEAISLYRKAVELAPSNAIMIGGLAWVLCYGGYPEEAIPLLQQAMRLSPYYPAWMVGTLALAFMMTGDYPKAIVANEQLIERNSLLQFGYSRLAAIHAELGDDEKAKAHAAELLKIKPNFSISKWSKVLIYKDKELLDWELNALRLAGLPE